MTYLKANKVILLLFIFAFSTKFCEGENLFFEDSLQSNTGLNALFSKNKVNYGVDKNVNTYYFRANAFLDFNLFEGNLKIDQSYKGTALQTNNISFRDDELFNLRYELPTIDKLSFLLIQNIVYSSDTRSIGFNKLEKIKGAGGFKFNFSDNSFLETFGGVEHNQQLNITALGSLFGIKGQINNLNLGGYQLNSFLNSEYIKYDSERNQGVFDFNSGIYKSYSAKNKFNLTVHYKVLNQDFLHPSELFSSHYYIENRFEKNFNTGLNLNFGASKLLTGFVKVYIENIDVARSYNHYIENSDYTGVIRNLNEFNLHFNSGVQYKSKSFEQNLGLSYSLRNETNNIENKYNIEQISFDKLLDLENRKDNLTQRTQLNFKSKWNISRKDSLNFSGLITIMHYDTPSKNNYDDRDEQATIMNIDYYHKFSDILSANIIGEIQLNHLVFLKALRSSMNNWNRIFRLSPSVKWKTKHFSINPHFEVLANYTIYDFEEFSPGVQSFSFRQISYEDSIIIKITKSYKIVSKIDIRYFERGILYWKSFSESPQNANYQQFTNVLLVSKLNDNFSVGFGGRFYDLNQTKLDDYSLSNKIYQFSMGPETMIEYRFKNGSQLSLHGWLEYQKTNNSLEFKSVPNFFLNSNIII